MEDIYLVCLAIFFAVVIVIYLVWSNRALNRSYEKVNKSGEEVGKSMYALYSHCHKMEDELVKLRKYKKEHE